MSLVLDHNHHVAVMTKGLRSRGVAVASPIGAPISRIGQRQRLRPSLAAAAAAAPAAAGQQAGGGPAERIKALVKSIGAGLPLVAFSTISGGVLAGSLHTVTGASFRHARINKVNMTVTSPSTDSNNNTKKPKNRA
jgi:hypothetical protein